MRSSKAADVYLQQILQSQSFPGSALLSIAYGDLTTTTTHDPGHPSLQLQHRHQSGLERTILLLFPLSLYVIT